MYRITPFLPSLSRTWFIKSAKNEDKVQGGWQTQTYFHFFLLFCTVYEPTSPILGTCFFYSLISHDISKRVYWRAKAVHFRNSHQSAFCFSVWKISANVKKTLSQGAWEDCHNTLDEQFTKKTIPSEVRNALVRYRIYVKKLSKQECRRHVVESTFQVW